MDKPCLTLKECFDDMLGEEYLARLSEWEYNAGYAYFSMGRATGLVEGITWELKRGK